MRLRAPKFIQIAIATVMVQLVFSVNAQVSDPLPAIYDTNQYLPLLTGKNIGVVANQTSVIGDVHLVDFLLEQEIKIKTVFAPEHGFRGKADAGEKVEDGKDAKTGLPIISLYGKNKKPSQEMLEGLDLILFDIQDVGVRFYTYISTLSYVMEAAAEKGIRVMVLDRPNPNGYFIDGPVLKSEFSSFVGLHPVPVVYALTIGEYGKMVNGEGWLKDGLNCDYTVIPCLNYRHAMRYSLPVKPSPNLPNDLSIALYPSLCFFEGTIVSVGRGTNKPFQQYGAPWATSFTHVFTPTPNEGAKYPKHENKPCYGKGYTKDDLNSYSGGIDLEPLILMYQNAPDKQKYFNAFFKKLAGTDQLQKDIEAGKSEEDIKAGWESELEYFKQIRAKYLIYQDYE
ncbi:MAG: DUF1343 domain-containing protein [Schleiferiaceae bacterium]|nr:DUF1343 domain-containing protein [Schleiferiaceae bacterium]